MKRWQDRSEDLENQLNRSALWAVTYGDMMSYMMIFFLMLFSFGISRQKERQYQESLVNIQKAFGGHVSSAEYERVIKREREEEMAKILEKKLEKMAKVESWDKKVRLILAEGVLFASGRAELTQNAKVVLGEVIDQMKDLPNPIQIEGHTDNVPIRGGPFATNWELSMSRAYAVLRFFEQRGISSSRLAAIGYGEYRPAADNKEAAGRARNRRIEIDLIRTD